MKVITLLIKLIYFSSLLGIVIFLIFFPGNNYKDTLLDLFFWLSAFGYFTLVITKHLQAKLSLINGMGCFLAGALIFSSGLFRISEIILKLGFIFFSIGLLQSFLNLRYNK